MQHPDEGVIHTWLDGELPAEKAAALEAHIAECADCAALVAEARGLIAASSRIVSALDIVPGDVIPAAIPRKRPWYANTQLRAAAAVVIVAGASLIVMREERAPEMKTVMDRAVSADSSPATASAEAAAPAEPPQFSIGKTGSARRESQLMTTPPETRAQANPVAPAPTMAATPRQSAPAAKQRADVRDESAVAETKTSPAADAARLGNAPERAVLGKIAGVQAQGTGAAPPAADLQQRNLSRLRDSAVRYDNVVVTGVATATSDGMVEEAMREAKLREVKADTTGNVVVTTYELSPGIQLTLTETASQPFTPRRAEADEMKKEKSAATKANAAVPAPPSPVIALRANVRIESITWTNSSTGRVYKLSGPLTKEQLTALRKRLPPARQ